MNELKTTFAGLNLKNPVIISSSGLTNSAEKNKKLEDAGAAAIVLKSLFEEQITLQTEQMLNTVYYPEGMDYLREHIRSHNLVENLNLIKETKRLCKIPVIASINCFSNAEWVSYAHTIEMAGADALELNILSIQTAKESNYGAFEQKHIDILQAVKKYVHIPVIVKLGTNITNPVALINQLYANGAAAVVLFNRFYQPDINIEKMEYTSGEVFSHPGDISNSLRWIGISSAVVDQIDYAASGGVFDGKDIVKAILAGASAVEICSTVYKHGGEWISPMLETVEKWMNNKGYKHIEQFKGLMNAKDIEGINMFERTQFLKYFQGKE